MHEGMAGPGQCWGEGRGGRHERRKGKGGEKERKEKGKGYMIEEEKREKYRRGRRING